jgi:hypothetical protein
VKPIVSIVAGSVKEPAASNPLLRNLLHDTRRRRCLAACNA